MRLRPVTMSIASGIQALRTMNRPIDQGAEAALIEQCRRQNYDAFSKIVDAYQARVLGFVKRSVRNPEEALDVTQEVFIRAFQAMDKFDSRSSLRTWLFRIAHNLCVDRARKAGRTPVESRIDAVDAENGEAWDFADDRWNPEEILLQDELKSVVDDALLSMSEKLRSVLWMHDSEGMAYEEIAASLDIPLGTVKSRLFLARGHIKQYVESYWKEELA
jgi:RNA polymerase sigma-70 factor (ECF subfamily)